MKQEVKAYRGLVATLCLTAQYIDDELADLKELILAKRAELQEAEEARAVKYPPEDKDS